MYKLIEGGIKNLETGAESPEAPKNKQWKAYQKWLAEGNTPEPMDVIDPWVEIRMKRDQLLQACDWVMCVDSPLNSDQGWLDYRDALRDIPQEFSDPEDVIWPKKP